MAKWPGLRALTARRTGSGSWAATRPASACTSATSAASSSASRSGPCSRIAIFRCICGSRRCICYARRKKGIAETSFRGPWASLSKPHGSCRIVSAKPCALSALNRWVELARPSRLTRPTGPHQGSAKIRKTRPAFQLAQHRVRPS